ncbi:XRE family transcriptional regulator [Streptomyces sp. NPDC002758]
MHRLDDGQPIREAIADAGLSIERLAEKTKQVDPLGYGISRSAVGHMVATGPSGRDEFNDRSCDLVARALDKPIKELFDTRTPT